MNKLPLKIMMLDDDPDFLSLAYGLLTKAGYEVYPFARAEMAWDMLDPLKPDFLLLDLNMPALDGREFVPWARKKCPELKIVICTGLEVHSNNSVFQENGVRHILKKPVSASDLIKTLELAAVRENGPSSPV